MTVLGDSKRIKRVLSNNGIRISTEQAKELWDYYSNCLCATWLGLPENDNDLLQEVSEVVKNQKRRGYANERPTFFDVITPNLKLK